MNSTILVQEHSGVGAIYTPPSHVTFLTSISDSVKDPTPWKCLVYFLFISLPLSLFAYCWIWATFFFAISTTPFIFLGHFFWLLSAMSWRSLGYIDLVSTRLCYKGEPEQLPNITYKSDYCVAFPPELGGDYTWKCFAYFLLLKWFFAIFTFVAALLLLVLGIFPPLLPFITMCLKKMGEWNYKFARNILINANQKNQITINI
ncbi:17523_t:CDS:2 [Cetraspora pellucida]|uniref:17523_t:CDS:1 n=1 Tax=Cetraspora pellucida TaxID=1433469 RepID=A0ACA9LPL1_9GLOM|nr:17523_t:CDS:2 [Cetraspora pellucida]